MSVTLHYLEKRARLNKRLGKTQDTERLSFFTFPMKMRNPIKPKKKSRRFAELQEDTGFTDAQFETPETPSKLN